MSWDGWPVLPAGVRPEGFMTVSEGAIEDPAVLRQMLGDELVDVALQSPGRLQQPLTGPRRTCCCGATRPGPRRAWRWGRVRRDRSVVRPKGAVMAGVVIVPVGPIARCARACSVATRHELVWIAGMTVVLGLAAVVGLLVVEAVGAVRRRWR